MHFSLRKYLWFIFGWIAFHAAAQNRDNIWQLGGNLLYKTKPTFGINFNNGRSDTFTLHRKMQFFITGAGICDKEGQLLFYTNGVWIANRNNDSLNNTTGFNPGLWTDLYGSGGLGFSQAAIVLPEPGSDSHYLLFYVTAEDVTAHHDTDVQPLHLSYSEINMNLDEGKGAIVEGRKNIHVIEDTLSQGRITACKHANGRDWWVIIHKYYSDIYYKVLVTPDTMIVSQQEIGNEFTSNDIFGMASFSPDGSKYCQVNINDTADLLNFDRCTGELSNPQTLTVPKVGYLYATLGCSFSPNSRYLYINSYFALWQFDTWNENVDSSKILIDTVAYLESDNFLFLNQAAPDGKIYISSFNSDALQPVLSVINLPDSESKNCNFDYSGFPLPPVTSNTFVPNFPNYDLGPLEGGGCDTIITGISNQVSAISEFKLSPNPANSYFNITYQTDANATLEITDLFGREVMHSTLYPYFKNRIFYTNELNDGMYIVTIKSKEGQTSKKLIIAK